MKPEIEHKLQGWLNPAVVWRPSTPEEDLKGIDGWSSKDTGWLSWGFRQRPGRKGPISDFTVRYGGTAPEKHRFCEFQKLQVGIRPDFYCYFYTDGDAITDAWVIDMSLFCQPQILLKFGGHQNNGDNSSFVYYSDSNLGPCLVKRLLT